jgi:hypothetical protein
MRRALLKSVKASGMLMINAIARGAGSLRKKRSS